MTADASVFVHATAVVDARALIGRGTKIWHFCQVMPGAQIGPDCMLAQGCFVASTVRIGRGVRVQNHVSLYDGVVLEDDVFVGPSAVFMNVKAPRAFISKKAEYTRTFVRRGASIGANATLVCGISIGQYAFVAAGAVVSHDVRDYELVAGVPARHLGWVSRHGDRLDFQDGQARCPTGGESYRLVNDSVTPELP